MAGGKLIIFADEIAKKKEDEKAKAEAEAVRKKYGEEAYKAVRVKQIAQNYGNKGRENALKRTVGFDTLQNDLSSMGKTIEGIYGGWQSPETMSKTKNKIGNIKRRINAYQEYRKLYGGDNMPDLTELSNGYKTILDGWDDLSSKYAEYGSADAYKRMTSISTADIKTLETEIAGLEEILGKAKGYEAKLKGYTNRKNTWERRGNGLRTDVGYGDKITATEKEYADYLKSVGYSSIDEMERMLNEYRKFEKITRLNEHTTKITSKSDYEQNSNYSPIKPKTDEELKAEGYKQDAEGKWYKTWGLGYRESYVGEDSDLYTYINDESKRLSIETDQQTITGSESSYKMNGYHTLTDVEKGAFNYLYHQDRENGTNTAEEYIKAISPLLQQRAMELEAKRFAEISKEHPVIMSGISLGTNFANGLMFPAKVAATATGAYDDMPILDIYGNKTVAIRGAVSEDMGEWGKLAYNAAMSLGDMGVAMLAGGGNAKVVQAIMSSSAGSSAISTAKKNGASDGKALVLGLGSAAIEWATEKYSVEALLKKPKKILGYIATNTLTEGTEEGVSNISNTVLDALVSEVFGERSEIEQRIDYLVLYKGKTEEEAFKIAANEKLQSLGEDMLVGALSGFGISSVAASPAIVEKGVNSIRNISSKNTTQKVNYEHLYDENKVSREFINSVNSEIENAVINIRNGNVNSVPDSIEVAKLNDNAKNKISNFVGFDISDYQCKIEKDALVHIENRHGINGEHDKSLSDPKDLARIGYVLNNSDDISWLTDADGNVMVSNKYNNKDNKLCPIMLVSAKIDGTYCVGQVVPDTKRKTIWITSVRIQKADVGSQVPNGNNITPQLTSETPLVSSSALKEDVSHREATASNIDTMPTTSENVPSTKSSSNNIISQDKSIVNDSIRSNGENNLPLVQRLETQSRNNEPIAVEDVKKATGFGEEGSKLIAELASSEGMTFSQAKKAVETAYMAGRTNVDSAKVDFVTDTQIDAFYAGKKDRVMQDLSVKDNANQKRAKSGMSAEEGYNYFDSLTEDDNRIRSAKVNGITIQIDKRFGGGYFVVTEFNNGEKITSWTKPEEFDTFEEAKTHAAMLSFDAAEYDGGLAPVDKFYGRNVSGVKVSGTGTNPGLNNEPTGGIINRSNETELTGNANDTTQVNQYEYLERLGLPEEEQYAILEYKNSRSYILNEALYSGRELTAEEEKLVENVNAALDRFDTYTGKVYRNLKFNSREELENFVKMHMEGDIVNYPAFVSASKAVDGYPVEGEYLANLEIYSATAKDVSNIGIIKEQEVLFKTDSAHEVKKVKYDGKTAKIILEENGYEEIRRNDRTRQGYDIQHSEEHGGAVQLLQTPGAVGIQMQGVSGRNSEGDNSRKAQSREAVSGGQRDSLRTKGIKSDEVKSNENTRTEETKNTLDNRPETGVYRDIDGRRTESDGNARNNNGVQREARSGDGRDGVLSERGKSAESGNVSEELGNTKEENSSKITTNEKSLRDTRVAAKTDTDKFQGDEDADELAMWTTNRVGDEVKPKSISEIVATIEHEFGINITTGHIRGEGVLGQYNNNNRGVRTKIANNLPVISHELGHYFERTLGIESQLTDELIKELTSNLDKRTIENYPKNKLVREGVAEYVRRFLQNRETAAIDYAKFNDFFLKLLPSKDLAKLQQLADDINAYYSLDADTATSSIRLSGEGAIDLRTPIEKLEEMAGGLYQAWVDSNHAIKRFDRATGSNAYMLASNAAYSDAIAGQIVAGDLTDKNGQYISSGLKTVLHGIDLSNKEEYRLFGEYLTVKHGPERLNEGMRVFADDRKNSSAFMERRQAELEKQYPEFKKASERLYAFIKQFYKTWGVETGLISQTTLDGWSERWQYYVPFNRVMEKEKSGLGAKRGFANQNSTIKKARGSGRDIKHPIDNLIENIVKMVNAGVRNDVMRTITTSAEKLGADATFLEQVPMPMTATKMDMTGVKDTLTTWLEESDMDADSKDKASGIVKTLDDVLFQYGRGKTFGNVVTVLNDGTPQAWKINDVGLLQSLTSLSPKTMDGLLDAIAVTSRFMTANITGNNLVWSIFSNLPRDTMTFFTYSKNKNVIEMAKGVGSAYLNKVKGDKADPLYKEFLAMGGGKTSAYTADRNLAKDVRKKLSDRKFNPNPLDWIGFVSDVVEAGPRFATYKMMREAGMTPQEAFYEAMDITVNFRRGGRISREINKAVPFFNASIQGLDKFRRWITAEDVKGADRKKAVRTRAISYVAVSIALAAISYAINNGDDEKEEDYEQLSTYTKNSYWVIPVGGGKYFAIPKPREIGVLSSFFETCLEYGIGENDHAFDEFYSYASENFLPAIANDIAQVWSKGLVETGMNIIGSLGIIGVMGYLGANRDFLGRPIVASGLQNLEPKDQYTDRTSKLAYWLGRAFNGSPEQIDYAMQQILGGWWKYQKALFPVGEKNKDYTLGVGNTYIKDNQYSTDLTNWLYDRADATAKSKNSNPDDMEKGITAKWDSNMVEFYGTYYKKAKSNSQSTSARSTRQLVLDIIKEYQKGIDGDYKTSWQKTVEKVCKAENNTEYMPSVMPGEVTDGNGKKHNLSDVQYVEYQTDYLRLYWEIVEETMTSSMTTSEKANILTAAKRVAKEQATERTLKRIAAPSSEFAIKYEGVKNDTLTEFFAGISEADEDNSVKKKEVVNVISGLDVDDDDAWKLYLSRCESKGANFAKNNGISGGDYVEFVEALYEVDKPTESGKYGTFNQVEVEEAIRSIKGLSQEEKAILFQSVNTNWKKNPFR